MRLQWMLALVVLMRAGGAARADVPPPPPETVTVYPTDKKALESILSSAQGKLQLQALVAHTEAPGLQVVAFGEYHETNADAKKKGAGGGVPSALSRFSSELLPLLAPQASDLILETWITDGTCGKQESAAVKDVQKTTERPATTEDELVTLVKQAKAVGITPHILKLSCADYKALVDNGAEVNYEKLLKLITDLLHKKIAEVVKRRQAAGDKRFVMVYGGALHNDLEPRPELAPFSFGPETAKDFPGRYVEIDLYVPEFIERDEALVKESWYPRYKKRARPDRTIVVNRTSSTGVLPLNSYILLFPRGTKR